MMLAATLAAKSQSINSIDDIPTVDNDLLYVRISSEKEVTTNEEVNAHMAKAAEKLGGDVVVVTTDIERYSNFLRDFYQKNAYNENLGIAFHYDYVKNTYRILCKGEAIRGEEWANSMIDNFFDNLTENSTYEGLYIYFADSVAAHLTEHYQPAEDLSHGWAKYEIAKRSADNPLVNKAFLKDYLTSTQLSLALTTPYVDTAVKVYDAANLLSELEIGRLQNRIKTFVNSNNIDMVIVTIDYNNRTAGNGNNATENFAMDFYEYNDFGKGNLTKDGYDGVILTIDMQNRTFSILDVGKPNAQGIARHNSSSYISAMTPDLKSKKYFSAINTFIEAYQTDVENYQFIEKYASYTQTQDQYQDQYQYVSSGKTIKDMILESIGVGILVALAMLFFSRTSYKTIRKATVAGDYIKPDSFKLTVNQDIHISSHTDKTYSPEQEEREEREHRSYSSYDSDTHYSSSGRSFGGGSGSF